MEGFELLHLLTDTGELNRLSGHRPQRKGRTTTGIAVEFGENQARQTKGRMKFLSNTDRLLAGSRITNQENLLGTQQFLQPNQLIYQRIIDLPTPCSVVDLDIATLALAPVLGTAGGGEDILLGRIRTKNGHLDLLAKCGELLNGGRSDEIESNQDR